MNGDIRRLPLCLIVLLLASGPARGEGEVEIRTLRPRDRLELPFYVVEVGPKHPLKLAGRTEVVRFEAIGKELAADLSPAPGYETRIREDDVIAIPLDPQEPEGGIPVRHVLFRGGDPSRGEPRWSVVVLDVREERIGKHRVSFVDYDADGTFLTPFRDFLVTGRRSREIAPVAARVLLSGEAFSLTLPGKEATFRAIPDPGFAKGEHFPSFGNVARGLAWLNDLRARMNLPPVALSGEASRRAMLHVRYLAQNGGNAHEEDPSRPGFTREGLAAGLGSIGSMGGTDVVAAMEGHLGTLLHRMELIDPRVTEIGIAADANRVWIFTEWGEKRPFEGQPPSIFPGPDGAWSSGRYASERPDPRPEGTVLPSGLPVTCAFYGAGEVRAVHAELRSPVGPVDCWINESGRYDLRANAPQARAILMPRRPLASGRYRVILTFEQAGRVCRIEHEFRITR